MLDLFLVIQDGGIPPETTVHAVLESRDLRDENKSFGTIQSWVVQGVAVSLATSGNFIVSCQTLSQGLVSFNNQF